MHRPRQRAPFRAWQWGSPTLRLGQVVNSEDAAAQTVFIPCDARQVQLSYYWHVASQNSVPRMDIFQANVDAVTLQTLTEYDSHVGWEQAVYDLSSYACQSVTITFRSRQNEEGVTAFYVDDVRPTAYTWLNLIFTRAPGLRFTPARSFGGR